MDQSQKDKHMSFTLLFEYLGVFHSSAENFTSKCLVNMQEFLSPYSVICYMDLISVKYDPFY